MTKGLVKNSEILYYIINYIIGVVTMKHTFYFLLMSYFKHYCVVNEYIPTTAGKKKTLIF